MNLLVLAGFALAFFSYVWAVQTLALCAVGDGWMRLPFRHGSESKGVRIALKLALATGLLAIIAAYPLVIGEDPWRYHFEKFVPVRWAEAGRAAILAFGMLCVPLAIGVAAGWIKLGVRHSLPKLAMKVAKSFLIPIPLTVMEEPLFRGVVLEQFWRALPGVWGELLAVVAAAAIFSVVHFAKQQKHVALPALGLFAVGVVLNLAYLHGGHHYLLPVAIHAGGVWFIQMTRPVTEYRGPAWLIGYHSYPIGGLMGLAAVALIGVVVAI